MLPAPLRAYRLAVIGFSPSSGAPRRGLVPLDGAPDRMETGALGPALALALDQMPLGARIHLTLTPPTPEEADAALQEAITAEAAFLAGLAREAAEFCGRFLPDHKLCQICHEEKAVTRTQLLKSDGTLTPTQTPCCAYCLSAFLGGPADGKSPWAVQRQIGALVRDLRP